MTLEKDKIVLKKQISTGNFIRKKGMDFKKNEIILTKGTKINSRNISLIFLSGNKKVRVYKKPKIGILSSGEYDISPGLMFSLPLNVSSSAYSVKEDIDIEPSIAKLIKASESELKKERDIVKQFLP